MTFAFWYGILLCPTRSHWIEVLTSSVGHNQAQRALPNKCHSQVSTKPWSNVTHYCLACGFEPLIEDMQMIHYSSSHPSRWLEKMCPHIFLMRKCTSFKCTRKISKYPLHKVHRSICLYLAFHTSCNSRQDTWNSQRVTHPSAEHT